MISAITHFLTGSSVWVYVFIFFGKMIEVALASLRTLMITKGQRTFGAIISVFEYAIWLCITGAALSGLSSDPLKMIVLIAAFAFGQIAGSWIEEKIALGYTSLFIIFSTFDSGNLAVNFLREKGYAVTIIQGEGRNADKKLIAFMVVKRRSEKAVKKMLKTLDSKAVINSTASNGLNGGLILGRR